MVLKDETVAKLRRLFALNLYEVKIWISLLSKGVSSAGELSSMSNVPRSRTYDVLESLERKGFVIMKLGKPIQYIAVAPKDVVERAKKNVKEYATERVNMLEKVKGTEVLNTLDSLYEKGINFVEPAELSGALKGRANIISHIESLIKSAKQSVVLVTSEEGLERKADALKSAFEAAKKRNVKIRIAAPLKDEKESEVVKRLKGVAEFKSIPEMDARFVLIDDKHAMMMVLSDKDLHPNYDIGVWINSPQMAGALGTMFNAVWDAKK